MKILLSVLLSISVVMGLVAGCATSPDKISPTYVSPLQYSHLDCEQIRQEIIRVNNRISEVAGVQQKKASEDAVATGVGVVLFLPALLFLAGGDRKEELARLKGEYEALQVAAIEKKCGFADEMAIVEVQDAPAPEATQPSGASAKKTTKPRTPARKSAPKPETKIDSESGNSQRKS